MLPRSVSLRIKKGLLHLFYSLKAQRTVMMSKHESRYVHIGFDNHIVLNVCDIIPNSHEDTLFKVKQSIYMLQPFRKDTSYALRDKC